MIEEKRSVVVGQIYGGIGLGEKPQWVECIKEGGHPAAAREADRSGWAEQLPCPASGDPADRLRRLSGSPPGV
jgi:hypothetical protein